MKIFFSSLQFMEKIIFLGNLHKFNNFKTYERKTKNQLESWALDLVSVLHTVAALSSGDPSQLEEL